MKELKLTILVDDLHGSDVANELREKVRSLQEELHAVRETNVRLARELEVARVDASATANASLLATIGRLTGELRELRELRDRLHTQVGALRRMLVDERRHRCPSPLGNPTREEAIEALRIVVHYADTAVAFPEARDLASLIDSIGDIARAVLPKTYGAGPGCKS